MKVKPLKDYVLARVVKKKEEEIVLTVTREVTQSICEIIDIGPDVKDVKSGDVVVVQDYGRIKVDPADNGSDFFLKEENIIGLVLN